MRGLGLAAASVGALYLAVVLQIAVANSLSVGPATPDFPLVALTAIALHSNRKTGALMGLAAGALQGALAGANLTHYAISRTIGGFLVSWSRDLNLQRSSAYAGFVGFALTLVAGLLFMFLAAPPGIGSFLGATIVSGLYNGLLAAPACALAGKLARPDYR